MGDIELEKNITDDILTDEDNLLNSTQDILSKGLKIKSDSLQDDIKNMNEGKVKKSELAIIKDIDLKK